MRRPSFLLSCALVLVSGAPVFAWKTRKAIAGTVHGDQAQRAMEILALKLPTNRYEWDRFGHRIKSYESQKNYIKG